MSDKPTISGESPDNRPIAEVRVPNTWAFVLPLLAFMMIAMLYPSFEQATEVSINSSATAAGGQHEVVAINPTKTKKYVALIGVQVVVAVGLLLFFRKTYLEQFPISLHIIAVVVGVIGVFLWVGLCALGIERGVLEPFGWSTLVQLRASFNPFEQIPDHDLRTLFFVLRFSLLAVLVPIIEELFLRGWLIRYVENPRWWDVSLLRLSFRSVACASLYGVLTHPGEAVAALVWFSLVSWLMLRTGSLWDCVVAHAVTNLLLGVYIVNYSVWYLW